MGNAAGQSAAGASSNTSLSSSSSSFTATSVSAAICSVVAQQSLPPTIPGAVRAAMQGKGIPSFAHLEKDQVFSPSSSSWNTMIKGSACFVYDVPAASPLSVYNGKHAVLQRYHEHEAMWEVLIVELEVNRVVRLPESCLKPSMAVHRDDVHPAILQLGKAYSTHAIVGGNARCVAFIHAIREYITDFKTPWHKDFSRHFSMKLNKVVIPYLVNCRKMSFSMGTLVRFIKSVLATIPSSLGERKAKEKLLIELDCELHKINAGCDAISREGAKRIKEGDTVLVFGKSYVVEQLLKKAAADLKNRFFVVVVDSRPNYEGRQMLEALVAHGIKCSYLMINAVSNIMPTVSKVFLGAAAMFANGTMLSRTGTALVALIATSFNVPVLVCCEVCKFSHRAVRDSIEYNELGNPDQLVGTHVDPERENKDTEVLSNWAAKPSLYLLNPNYDVTPVELISMVICDVGNIPATSVPAVLREREQLEQLVTGVGY